jgi:hypothetical protein
LNAFGMQKLSCSCCGGRSSHGRVGGILNRTGSMGLLAPSQIQVHTRIRHMIRMTC